MEDRNMENGNIHEKVSQTILHGSVYESIYANFITVEDVLKFLLKTKAKDEDEKKKFNIAYAIICNLTQEHYLDGNHFISLTDDIYYIGLYFLLNCIRGTRLDIKKNGISVRRKCENIQIELFNKEKYFFVHLLGENILNNLINETNVYVCAQVRSGLYMPIYLNRKDLFIKADWISHFKKIADPTPLTKLLIKRGRYLKTNAPLYWEGVMKPQYAKFMDENIGNIKLDSTWYNKFKSLFPQMNIESTPHYIYKISVLPDVAKAYVLGFPIHEYIPSKNSLEEKLKELQTLGIKKYVEAREKEERENYEFYSKTKNMKLSNSEDASYETFESYNSFDVINHITDSTGNIHIFRFTRKEFNKLVEEKTNFYTREVLPEIVMAEIRKRLSIASKNLLPQSAPILDLLLSYTNHADKVKEGFINEIVEKPNNIGNVRNDENNEDGNNENNEDENNENNEDENNENNEDENNENNEDDFEEDDEDDDEDDFEEDDDEDDENDFEELEEYDEIEDHENIDPSQNFYAKAKNSATGEIVIFEFPISSFPEVSIDDLEEFFYQYFPDMGMEYIGRVRSDDVPGLMRNHRLVQLKKYMCNGCPECSRG